MTKDEIRREIKEIFKRNGLSEYKRSRLQNDLVKLILSIQPKPVIIVDEVTTIRRKIVI